MSTTNRVVYASLGALFAAACADAGTKPSVETSGHRDQTGHGFEFTMLVDPSAGTMTVINQTWRGLEQATTVQDGVPGSGPANTVELVTTSVANDPTGAGACGFASSFCGDVTLRSFYTGPINSVEVEITAISPEAGHLPLNGDDPVMRPLGVFQYGDLGPGGAGSQQWVFGDDGTAWRLSGRVLANLCFNGIQDGAETGVDCGGPECVACMMGPTCMDGIQNGDETGIDCGGTVCPACGPTCMDGIQNGDETGIDCGGTVCPACGPTCTDGIQNGGETGIDCGGPCPNGCNLVINEVEYDEVGTDTGEFVEIFNPTGSPADLTNLAVFFVNGAATSHLQYDRVNLSGTLAAGAFAIICQGTGGACANVTVPGGTMVFNFTTTAGAGNIQNGAPDALGLINVATATMIDALSYEGSETAGVTDVGTFNFVEGTPTPLAETNADTNSLQRIPNGSDTNDANTDWALGAPTPGAAN